MRASASASTAISAKCPNSNARKFSDIYQEKGFKGVLLERIVDTITANRDVWVAVMMAEEHQLSPVNRQQALRAAVVVGFSAIVGSLIPLLPFAFLSVKMSMWAAIVIAAITLFVVGAYKARVTVGHPERSGLEMAIIGTVSALVGYVVGLLLKVPAANTRKALRRS